MAVEAVVFDGYHGVEIDLGKVFEFDEGAAAADAFRHLRDAFALAGLAVERVASHAEGDAGRRKA